MPSGNREILFSFVEQNPKPRTIEILPRFSSADGDVVLARSYKETTEVNEDGTKSTGSLVLPTKGTGTITFDYRIGKEGGEYSVGTFHFSHGDGSDIDFDDLIAAGGEASDTVIDYINEHLAAGQAVPFINENGEPLRIPMTAAGLIPFLNEAGSHADIAIN